MESSSINPTMAAADAFIAGSGCNFGDSAVPSVVVVAPSDSSTVASASTASSTAVPPKKRRRRVAHSKIDHTYRDFAAAPADAVRLTYIAEGTPVSDIEDMSVGGTGGDAAVADVAVALLGGGLPQSQPKAKPKGKVRNKGTCFPRKLYEIVTNPEYAHIIRFMPHGRSWTIINKAALETEILPKYFNHGRFESFNRQVNGWGFKRLFKQGPDHKSYYHELFLRGRPELAALMVRLVSPGKRLPDKDMEPDFYDISSKSPLPEVGQRLSVVQPPTIEGVVELITPMSAGPMPLPFAPLPFGGGGNDMSHGNMALPPTPRQDMAPASSSMYGGVSGGVLPPAAGHVLAMLPFFESSKGNSSMALPFDSSVGNSSTMAPCPPEGDITRSNSFATWPNGSTMGSALGVAPFAHQDPNYMPMTTSTMPTSSPNEAPFACHESDAFVCQETRERSATESFTTLQEMTFGSRRPSVMSDSSGPVAAEFEPSSFKAPLTTSTKPSPSMPSSTDVSKKTTPLFPFEVRSSLPTNDDDDDDDDIDTSERRMEGFAHFHEVALPLEPDPLREDKPLFVDDDNDFYLSKMKEPNPVMDSFAEIYFSKANVSPDEFT